MQVKTAKTQKGFEAFNLIITIETGADLADLWDAVRVLCNHNNQKPGRLIGDAINRHLGSEGTNV